MTSKATPLPPPNDRQVGQSRKRGKKYAAAKALVTKPVYPLAEAVELLTKLSTAKFDAAAEVHIRINADTTQADQLVRTTVSLPHGTGKTLKIAAFIPDDQIDEAKKAGADLAGNDDLIKHIEEGNLDFDIVVASPKIMKNLGKVAKTLGQKGLMPSPKAGTVTEQIGKVIQELKKGRIELKMDKLAIVHAIFGRVSFGAEKLRENLEAVMHAIKEAQPSGIKGDYIRSVSVSPTMGPGVKIAL